MLPDSFLTELKYNSDIEQVIRAYVNLKHTGRTLKGLCPFHSEKSPSFVVYPENQSFYCFGCGAGGDVVTFIRRVENLEYMEAIRFLAQRAGMTLPEDVANDRTAQLRARILSMNREAARYFHSVLLSEPGKLGLEYLTGRGLLRRTTTRFGLGFAPNSWDSLRNHLREKGYSYEEMQAASLVSSKDAKSFYDTFRGRVIFPIIDLRGNVIAFGGRILSGDGPKYLNSGDTLAFKKSRNLFAMNLAKNSKTQSLILAEGYMDVVALHQAGFDNAIATLGTALTSDQARLIAQYCKEIVVAYDSDGPGQAATKRAINLFDETGVHVRVLSIPDAKDPDEFIKKFGAARFKLLLDGSANAIEYEISKLRAKYDCDTEDGKVNFLKEFCTLMAGIRNPIERDVYLIKWANALSVSKEALQAQVNTIWKRRVKDGARKEERNLRSFDQEVPINRQDPQRAKYMKYALAEDKLLVLLLRNPDYYEYIADRLTPQEWVTDVNRELYLAISRRLAANQSVDMITLAGELDEDKLARLSWLLATSEERRTFTRQEADDYIDTIRGHALEKSDSQVAQMDNRELEEYVRQLSANKK